MDRVGILVHKDERKDLALIPLATPVEETLPLCNIGKADDLDYWDELVGFKAVPKRATEMFLNAFIRELNPNQVVGTFPGTNGYSGVGYFSNRALVAVHKGAHPFNGSIMEDESFCIAIFIS